VNKKKGIVYLVGAGPGDASLLTLKGLWCLEQADVVVFDRLACEYMLTFCRPDAELIYVGKETNRHTLKQEEINSLLVTKAREGKVVCRLKGGDPFVFGRGGEEAESLVDNGLPFEIVPGVTSAVAVPAYAGIPVTHRDHASALKIHSAAKTK
jgi:uroporphyrinogen III methyltransferase/synthase